MENEMTMPEQNTGAPQEKPRKILKRETKLKIFVSIMVIYPILYFLIFYVYMHIESILLAFQRYIPRADGTGFDITFAGFDNFKNVIGYFLETTEGYSNLIYVRNSILYFFLKMFVGFAVSLFFAYYCYKKFLFAGFFRVILFLPNLISSILMVILYEYMVEDVFIFLFDLKQGMIGNPKTRLGTLIFFNLWLGFASQILMLTSAMSGINESLVESAQLDGCNPIKEFWFITLPMIFPTFITMLIGGMAAMFTDQMSLYTFYQYSAQPEISTVGYFMYCRTLLAGGHIEYIPNTGANPLYFTYGQLAALGLCISLVTTPTILVTKRMLEKYGPNTN